MSVDFSSETAGLFGILEETAQRLPEAIFLREGDRELTYAEVSLASRRLAGWLQAQGVKRGDRVAICCRNRSEIAVAIFGTALLGAIFVVLNSSLKPHGLGKILRQTNPAAMIADEQTQALFEDQNGTTVRLLVTEQDCNSGWILWSDAMAHEALLANSWPGVDVDPVSLIFTSGSTGDPRGVTLSHQNICFVTAAIQKRLDYRAEDTVGCFLPLAFDYGLYQIFLAARGGAALMIGDPSQVGPRLPSILERSGVTVLPGVPTVYACLIAIHERRPFELPNLRAITNTGERLLLSTIAQMEQIVPGLDVFPMYGLTECKRVSILLPDEFKLRPESVGRPLDGTEVYAVDEHGRRLAPGETGELVVIGRHVAHGYWRAPEETEARFQKIAPENPVELFTGDRGSVDEEGYIYFAARADDLIKHRGNRISPAEIEIEATDLRGVIQACVAKRKVDDTLHLFVTVSDSRLEAHGILRDLEQKLEVFKVPDEVHFLPELPKSMNGKVDRKALLSLIEPSAAALS
ncbi:MAG: class I adenylate-forming enzyme family protein [Verrucomicrobiota bacterium]